MVIIWMETINVLLSSDFWGLCPCTNGLAPHDLSHLTWGLWLTRGIGPRTHHSIGTAKQPAHFQNYTPHTVKMHTAVRWPVTRKGNKNVGQQAHLTWPQPAPRSLMEEVCMWWCATEGVIAHVCQKGIPQPHIPPWGRGLTLQLRGGGGEGAV